MLQYPSSYSFSCYNDLSLALLSTAHQNPLAFQSDALGMMSNVPNEVGVGTNATAGKPSEWAVKDDWARYQALIKQLYLYEKKSLNEVMHHMEDQYGFKATLVIRAVLFFRGFC